MGFEVGGRGGCFAFLETLNRKCNLFSKTRFNSLLIVSGALILQRPQPIAAVPQWAQEHPQIILHSAQLQHVTNTPVRLCHYCPT